MKKFIFTIIALLGTLMPTSALAQDGSTYREAYAVLKYESENDAYLTMYYDDKKASHAEEGVVVGINELAESPDLIQARRTLHSVIFDQSFADCDTIKSTKGWFAYCMELRTISGLEYLNTSEVTDMDIMFMECSSLESLDLSHFNTSKVTTMSNMFFMNSSLQTLDLSSFDTSNVTDMSSMFANCYSLTTIYVGSYWSTASVTESDGMFSGCSSLVGGAGTTFSEDHTDKAYAHIDRADQPGYLTYGQSGGKGEAEPYAVLSEDNTILTFYYDDQKAARNGMDVGPFDYVESAPGYNGHNDDRGWYDASSAITTVVFDDSFENYLPTSTAFWFRGCTALSTISGIKNLKTDNVTNMYAMFAGCSSLTSIDVSGFKTDNVTDANSIFEGCSKLINLDVSSFNTTNMTVMTGMFSGCSSLTNIDVSGFNTANVVVMSAMFSSCSDLTVLDLSNFNTKNVFSMRSMFQNCSHLKTIYVGAEWSTAALEDNNVFVFGGCYSLVGGAGTKYDEKNEDATYAHIDGGEANPGYLTDIADKGKEKKEQVTAPYFEFSADSLIIKCDTEGAGILYSISRSSSSRAEDGGEFAQYTEPVIVNYDATIAAFATKENMENSDTITFVYPYTEWQELIETTYICDKVLSEILQSKPSENITKMIDDVYVELAYVRDEYEGHRLEWDRDKIEDEIMKLKHVVAEIEEEWKKESSEATYENLTLTVGGANIMATALEMVGGRAEVTKDIAAIVWNSTEPLTKSDLEGFDNPNMLIYVQADSLAPEGVENVVIDGKAKSIVLIDTDSINNNFYAPQEFTAESISYTREFKQTTQKDVSRGWEGICLPFTVQSYTHESHGAIAPFRNDNSEFHFWLHQMTEQGMATATNIEANMPYIISMPNNTSYPATYNQAGKVTFSAKNAVVPVSVPSMIHLADGSIGIAGVYNSLSKMEGFYALNVGDDMDEYPEGSVFVNNYRTIRPFEVYSYHADRSAGTRSIISVASLFTGGVDGATGILDATDKQDSDEVKVYSVNGILLKKGNRNEVINSLPKGLYIIGNQKIMVK